MLMFDYVMHRRLSSVVGAL